MEADNIQKLDRMLREGKVNREEYNELKKAVNDGAAEVVRPPVTELEKTWKPYVRAGVWILVALPLLGLCITVFGMVTAFKASSGSADPSGLSSAIMTALQPAFWMMLGIPLGLAFLLIGLVRRSKCRVEKCGEILRGNDDE